MRLPNAAHESHPWRIREIAPDFTLEDVWALPVHGVAGDFEALLEQMVSSDPANNESLPARVLWAGPRSPRQPVRPRQDLDRARQEFLRWREPAADSGYRRNVARRATARGPARQGDRGGVQ